MTDEKKQVGGVDGGARDVSLSLMTNSSQSPYAPEGASPRPWMVKPTSSGGALLVRGTDHHAEWGASTQIGSEADARLILLAVSNYEEACRLLEGLLGWGQLARLADAGLAKSIDGDPAWTLTRSFLQSAREQAAEGANHG